MKNNQHNHLSIHPFMKRLLLFSLLLLFSGAMVGQLPIVITTTVTDITDTTALCGGNVIDDGGSPVTDRGIFYSTFQPVQNGTQVSASSGGMGPFTINLHNLMPNTTYYVTAYATNSEGTSFGEVMSFTTFGFYYVMVSANPVNGGTVSGGGTYNHGATCTLTATPCWGFHFVNWTENGSFVSTNASYTFTVTGNRNLVANFAINQYTINALANPSSGGSVTQSGNGTYDYGANCTLTATPNTGYHFVNWTENGQVVPNAGASYTFTVTGNRTLVANFAINTYTITASANPSSGGTVSGYGTYNHGTTCTLTATPNTGYHFVNWTENGQVVPNAGASYTFTVTGNRTLVANFAINQYTINASVNPSNGGTVSGFGTYNHGTTCTLTATPNTGYHFINWTKNGSEVSTSPTYTFTVVEAGDYVANFTLGQYTITAQADPPAGGTVTGSGGYNHGETCTLVATANTGYTFVNWTKNGTEVSTTPTYSFTVTETAAYVAHFLINSYEITATANPSDGGTVSGGGTYNHFQSCTLTASQAEGHTFENWKKNGTQVSITPNYTFTVEGAGDYVATFSLNQYTISTNVTPTGTGTVSGGGIYYYGDEVTLTATNEYGYHFDHWQDGNTQNPRAITVSNNALYTATFAPNSYTITTNVTPTGTGTVTGGGTYTFGSTITLTATNEYGYHFDHWQDGNTNSTRTVTVSQDATYTATFSPNSYTITTTPSPWAGGTVSGGGEYLYNTQATLQATNNYGYHFDHWQDGNTQNPRTITVTQNALYTAYFIKNQYTITTGVEPNQDWGDVTGGGTYDYQSNIQLVATPNSGYSFQRWQDNNTQNPRQITVTENATYTATFTRNLYIITTNVTPTGAGTVTGGGSFYYGDHATLIATANSGYIFQGWSDGNTDTPRHIVVTNNATYTAVFGHSGTTYYNVTATVSPNGAGSVTGTGPFPAGSTTTLTANANTGYTFNHWQDGNTQNPRTVTVNSNLSFTAYFTQNTYTITTNVNPTWAGTVTGGGSYHYGDQPTLNATANEGYEFDHWNDGITQNPRQITVTGNATYTAYFNVLAPNVYTISTEVTPAGAGTVEGGGTYLEGETATLVATPNPGYTFEHWQDGNTDNPCIITVTGNDTYTAHFTQNIYAISVSANPENGGTVEGGGEYTFGETVTLTATANEGFLFDQWEDGVATNPRTITVTGDATYTANFMSSTYTIALFPDPLEGGTVEGGGEYTYGEECTINAIANPGYVFYGWFENDELVYSDATYTFVVTSDRTLVAKFADENVCLIFADIDPTGAGSVTGTGPYIPGDTCTLTAYAKPGYEFVNWTILDEVVSEDAVYTFTVTGSAYYVAHFERKKYTIIVTSNPENGGMVTGSGQYYYGAICTLSATPNPGYTFGNWMDDNNTIITTSPTYMFQVVSDVSYTANFSGQAIYMISATAGPNGSISPEGEVFVDQGNDQTFAMTPDSGCSIAKVIIDGVDIGVVGPFTFSYTFINVNCDHTISVSFSGAGVDETYALNVTIYPNPAKDKVYVEGEGIETVVLMDMLGNSLRSMEYNTGEELNLSGLPKGIYVLRVTTQDGHIGYRKLILK